LAWALGAVLDAARRWCGFIVTIEEPPHPCPLDDDRPVLVLARHGGLGDSFVLVWLLINRYDRRPRVVLKDILQWDPLIDVGLTRLDACFLPRRPAPTEDLPALLSNLAAGLGAGEALLIFPEGGNWTPRRRTRAISRLRAERRHRAAAAALLMEHVLPPRPAGVFACIDARPELPIVVVAHAGLDQLVTPSQVWAALPFRVPMTVRWWPVARPPDDEQARLQWLTTEWSIVDEWIDARQSPTTPP
jgi:1-acyl-sn-glycerol-3-phosphate acyltransferase